MNEEKSVLDIETLSTEEFAAQSILSRFPQAALRVQVSGVNRVFEIYLKEKILLKIDKRGVRYFFPSRRKRSIEWNKMAIGNLPRVIDYILRDLAEADYKVLSTSNKQLSKKPIHISRYAQCPICEEKGGIKVIFRGDSLTEENSEIYTPINHSITINGAEIKCTLCDWIGIREELQRKIRKSC